MKTNDQLLLEQAYDAVHLRCVPSKLTTIEISDKYHILTIYSEDIPMITYALRQLGLDKKGVKIISNAKSPLHVYLIFPRGLELGPSAHTLSKCNYLQGRIHNAIHPQSLRAFSYTTFPAGWQTNWNEVSSKLMDIYDRLPELKGMFD
jgi:hypothetical protein